MSILHLSKYFSFIFFITFLSCKKGEDGPIASDHRAYIVTGQGKTIDVIDLQSFELINTYDISTSADRFPHHIYISNDGQKLAVANPAYDFSLGHSGLHGKDVAGGILIINAATGELEKNIETPFANHNVTFSKDDSKAVTASFSHTGRVYVYDLVSEELEQEVIVAADPSEIVVTPDGQFAAVASGESSFVQMIDIIKGELVKQIKVDLSPSNVWEGNDELLIVTNAFRKSINFIDIQTQSVTGFIDFDFAPGFAAFNETKEQLWVCDPSNHKIRVFKVNGVWEQIAEIQLSEKDPHMIKFFENGNSAIAINQKGNSAVKINTDTFSIEKEINVGRAPNGIALSPIR
ncbi:hypothetical protein [Jiulongibacter sp. NS-SX5]|uniref:hypothetical protein n=1 Tax=Jiulongibacter sp. NS-SX5 TaxID=3463854 RepID=UPI004058F20F